MKNVVAATLFLTIIFISIPCGASSRQFSGACSSRLMDTLLYACGESGSKSMKAIFYMNRYRRRHWRTRGKREVSEYQPNLMGEDSEFNQKRVTRSTSRLSSIVEAGAFLNVQRVKHVRVRRQISRDCCVRRCSLAYLRRAYCNAGR